MFETYLIYAKDIIDFFTERGYRLGYKGLQNNTVTERMVFFYFKEKSVFRLEVDSLFIKNIVNCNSKNRLTSDDYSLDGMIVKLEADMLTFSNELQPASILFTFTKTLFREYGSATEKYNSFMAGYKDFASDFAALFKEELEAMKPANVPVTKIKMFDVFQKDNELFYVSGAAGDSYQLTSLFNDTSMSAKILEIRELTNGALYHPCELPTSDCILNVLNFLSFVFDKDVIRTSLGDLFDEGVFAPLLIPPVKLSKPSNIKTIKHTIDTRYNITGMQGRELSLFVDGMITFCSWDVITESDYKCESYDMCIKEIVQTFTKNRGLQGFCSNVAYLIEHVTIALLPFLVRSPHILNFLVLANNFYISVSKGVPITKSIDTSRIENIKSFDVPSTENKICFKQIPSTDAETRFKQARSRILDFVKNPFDKCEGFKISDEEDD